MERADLWPFGQHPITLLLPLPLCHSHSIHFAPGPFPTSQCVRVLFFIFMPSSPRETHHSETGAPQLSSSSLVELEHLYSRPANICPASLRRLICGHAVRVIQRPNQPPSATMRPREPPTTSGNGLVPTGP